MTTDNLQPATRNFLALRPATPADVPQILQFIRDLATYEREPDAVHATEADLLRDGFGERFDAASIAEWSCAIQLTTCNLQLTTRPVSPSTSTTTPPGAATPASISKTSSSPRPSRGKGIGKALLSAVAAIAVAEGCPRLEWSVLEWNQPCHRLLPPDGSGNEAPSGRAHHARHRRSPHRPRRTEQIICLFQMCVCIEIRSAITLCRSDPCLHQTLRGFGDYENSGCNHAYGYRCQHEIDHG